MPAGSADPLAELRAPDGTVRSTEAARSLAKRPRLRRRLVPTALNVDPGFESHARARRDWLTRRVSEHHEVFGAVSSAVGAMLNASSWLFAAGEFAAEKAAEAGDVELFKVAASLTTTARGHELAAWELAAREARARRTTSASPAERQRAFLEGLRAKAGAVASK